MSLTEKIRGYVTGCWKKSGANGTFMSGNFTRESFLKELDKFPGENEFTLYVSPNSKKGDDASKPDIYVSFEPKFKKKA
jgi:hypothetical protein